MARMRRGWRCSYRARITSSLLPVDARRIRTLACQSTVIEEDQHRQRGDVASPALCCRPCRGGRRRFLLFPLPKRYLGPGRLSGLPGRLRLGELSSYFLSWFLFYFFLFLILILIRFC
jgi:hypothetical protein